MIILLLGPKAPAGPAISNIVATPSTSDGTVVVVTWTTNVSSTQNIVDYGIGNYGTSTPAQGASTSHSRTISGLTPGATYQFRVRSTASLIQTTTNGGNFSPFAIMVFNDSQPGSGAPNTWTDHLNWFYNASYSVPAGRVPANGDYINMLNGTFSDAPASPLNLKGWLGYCGPDYAGTSQINITATGTAPGISGMRASSSGDWNGSNSLGAYMSFTDSCLISQTVTGDIFMSGAAYGDSVGVTGDAYLSEGATLGQFASVVGNLFATGNSQNQGAVAGAATFRGTSQNVYGSVAGHADFFDNSNNVTSCGSMDFWDSSINQFGGVSGLTVFHDSSSNFSGSGAGMTSASFYDNSYNGGGGGTFTGDYHNASHNDAGNNDSTYYDTSYIGSGWDNSNPAFFDSSYCSGSGTIYGDGTFSGSSIMFGSHVGATCIFYDSSSLQGGAINQGFFYSTSFANVLSYCNNDSSFFDDSRCQGTINGNCELHNTAVQNFSSQGVSGTMTCYDTSICAGSMGYALMFNDSVMTANAHVFFDADFEDNSTETPGATIDGNVTCNTTSTCVPQP